MLSETVEIKLTEIGTNLYMPPGKKKIKILLLKFRILRMGLSIQIGLYRMEGSLA